MTVSNQTDFYLNFNQFTGLKASARQHQAEASQKAGQQFEGLFIQQMLKEMRSAAVIDPEQHSSTMDFYTDMHDKQLSLMLSQKGGIGIAKAIEQQLNQIQQPYERNQNQGKMLPIGASSTRFKSLQNNAVFFPIETQQKQDYELKADAVKVFNLATQLTPSNHQPLPEEFHELQHQVDNSSVKLSVLSNDVGTANNLVDEAIESKNGWENPEHFIQELKPHAERAAKQLGVSADVLMAQSALETGWGKYVMKRDDGSVAFSLFGIKADSRWSGDTVSVTTHEFRNGRMQKETADFRAYDSIGEAMQDYVAFIRGSERYQLALQGTTDSQYVQGLQKAGYATDPQYANKIINITQGTTYTNALASLQHIERAA